MATTPSAREACLASSTTIMYDLIHFYSLAIHHPAVVGGSGKTT